MNSRQAASFPLLIVEQWPISTDYDEATIYKKAHKERHHDTININLCAPL